MQQAFSRDSHYHGSPRRTAVVLVNLGTPDSPGYFDDALFTEFLSDPRVVGLPRLLWLPFYMVSSYPARRLLVLKCRNLR